MDNSKEQISQPRGHCIALFSGGLDSALAILLMLRQNIEVTALTFMTHFGCDLGDRSSCGSDPYPASEKFGFKVKLMHLGQKFVDLVENPKYGYGSETNVCLDCRILMLREAKALMALTSADFIVTGEVVGQRPFSQLKDKIHLVEREAGLRGKLLRPLSARILSPTDAEISGMVDREKLEGISGRSRKRQIELAAELGLDDYPSPAGGCLLTDHAYSARLRDLLAHSDRLTFDDLNLLRPGRHFRLDDSTKVIVGRDEQENMRLEGLGKPGHWQLEILNTGSPLALLVGNSSELNLRTAGSITARYTKARSQPVVRVLAINLADSSEREFDVAPAQDKDITPLAIR